ncbi:hypothetical protein C8R46DRAFT_381289 [Mycena filopes]|nr:hypothetical protein C8R46DRAFT_381289 [Mycena filopes]
MFNPKLDDKTRSPGSSPSSNGTGSSRTGHQRNRAACSLCRRRKVKCSATNSPSNSPCERCVKEGATCEYLAPSSSDSEIKSRSPRWVEPLRPESYESYERDNTPQPPPFNHHAVESSMNYNGAQLAGLPGSQMPMFPLPQQDGQYYWSYMPPFYSTDTGQSNAPGNFPYPSAPPAPANNRTPQGYVHYGAFPGPANTVYPWTQPRSHH